MKLYNGIPLPALPEWDKTVYPYAIIQYGNITGLETYSLIVSTASGTMGDSYTIGEHTYSAWVVAANETAAENLSGAYPGISTKEWLQFEDGNTVTASTYDNIVWTNTDILKADGSVYLKASKPFDLDAFKIGLSLGLCGKALPWKADTILPSSCLLSFDGYVLQDVNGFNLRPKDSVLANYNDGPVYLAASAPVSVPTYDHTLLQGYIVGCRIRVMKEKKPTEPDTPVEPDVPTAALFSADGYILKDSNGIYITVKEFY